MSAVVLLTAEDRPDDGGETAAVARSLSERGVKARIVPWTDPELRTLDADLIVVRTTWDHTTRLTRFVDVLGSLDVPVRNGVDVVRWNSHKGYLADLVEQGVPAVLVRRGEQQPGRDPLPDAGLADAIVAAC